jgi:hypothetical protein
MFDAPIKNAVTNRREQKRKCKMLERVVGFHRLCLFRFGHQAGIVKILITNC